VCSAHELLTQPWEFTIVDDLQRHPTLHDSSAARVGMQSALLSPIRFSGRLRAMVCFLSRLPARFTEGDVLTAKRIARYIALAMSHDHLAAEAKRATELRERAANLELLEQFLSLTDTGELGDLFDRLSALARRVLPSDTLVLHVVVPERRPRASVRHHRTEGWSQVGSRGRAGVFVRGSRLGTRPHR